MKGRIRLHGKWQKLKESQPFNVFPEDKDDSFLSFKNLSKIFQNIFYNTHNLLSLRLINIYNIFIKTCIYYQEINKHVVQSVIILTFNYLYLFIICGSFVLMLQHMWKSEPYLGQLLPSFCYVGPRYQTRVLRHGSKCPCTLIHLSG